VFGVDVSVFGMSSEDYVFCSIDVVLILLFILLFVGLVVVWLYERFIGSWYIGLVVRVFGFSWLIGVVGVVLFLVVVLDVGNFSFLFWFVGGLFGIWYVMLLYCIVFGGCVLMFLLVFVILVILVVVLMFWMIECVVWVVGDVRVE